MRSFELVVPTRMSRVAIVASRARLREALVAVAAVGTVELVGALPPAEGEEIEAVRRLERQQPEADAVVPALSPTAVDVPLLEQRRALGLLLGEAELKRRAAMALVHGSFAVLVGWTPTEELPDLRQRLAEAGAQPVELPRPAWADPPTLFAPAAVKRPFRPLVETYGVIPYADVDPTTFAGVSFLLMFGMMFGDVGHGLVLAGLGLGLRRVRRGRLLAFQGLWPLPTLAGLSAAIFGLLYGEAFGPTGLVPRLWLDPIDRPVPLLVVAVAVGAGLLAVSHIYGTVNRWREAGATAALLSQSGFAGFGLLAGTGALASGWAAKSPLLTELGAGVAGVAVALMLAGFLLAAGRGASAIAEAFVELVDAVIRVASNALSFTRLAAFGLMHAALGTVVFDAARSLWGGVGGGIAAAVVLVLGNALAFSLELLVTGVQALRLEFYELFSRIFTTEGHRFSPWSIPTAQSKELS